MDPPLLSRIEYDAYRVDLEELNLGPRDATTVPKLEVAQREFQAQRERYEKMRDALSVKMKLLEENKVRMSTRVSEVDLLRFHSQFWLHPQVKVLYNQLWLLHSAVAANCISCHNFLEKNIKQASEHLGNHCADAPSWLEES